MAKVDWLERAAVAAMLGATNCGLEMADPNRLAWHLLPYMREPGRYKIVSENCAAAANEFFCDLWGGHMESDEMLEIFEQEVNHWVRKALPGEPRAREIWKDTFACYDLAIEEARRQATPPK